MSSFKVKRKKKVEVGELGRKIHLVINFVDHTKRNYCIVGIEYTVNFAICVTIKCSLFCDFPLPPEF